MILNINCRDDKPKNVYWVVGPVRGQLGAVWYMCLKTENCCLKTFVKICVGEKVR